MQHMGAGLLVLASLWCAAACSKQDDPSAAPAPPRTAPPTAPRTPSTTPAPSNAAEPPDSPEPATAPPPSTAGPLDARNMPAPAALGKGWQVYDDPGGAEKGFRGNGTWTRKRNAHQAAFEALPVGCAATLPTTPLPIPSYALQGTYRNERGGPAQLLVLRFADQNRAAAYFAGYQDRMRSCTRPGGTLVVAPLWSTGTAAAAVRRYTEELFTEVAVQDAASVALLATASTPGQPWTHTVATHLAATISR